MSTSNRSPENEPPAHEPPAHEPPAHEPPEHGPPERGPSARRSHGQAAGPTPWDPRLRALTLGLVSTVTLIAFEAMAVITVLPKVAEDLSGLSLYGWTTSGFFLGLLVGVVIAGAESDRVGAARPLTAGLVLFGAGLAVAALAPNMWILVAGRVLQGLGGGAVPAILYATIGRAYPEPQRPRMFAVTATAWVLPGLIGPATAALVAEHAGWRWVFGGLIPLVAVAGAGTVRALRGVPAPTTVDVAPTAPRLIAALRVSVGAGLVLAGLTGRSAPGLALVAVGSVLAYQPLRTLLPAGTLRARPGIAAAVAARGLLTFAFFGTDTFVPLAITAARHEPTIVASAAVTAVTVTWTTGSWTQARLAGRVPGRVLIGTGLLAVSAGTAGFALVLVDAVALAVPIACWAVAGLGMGLAYSPIASLVLAETAPERHGTASSAVTLSDNLGTALGTGLGGAAVAASEAANGTPDLGLATVFGLTVIVAALGALVVRRAPSRIFPAADSTPATS
ncbi:MFS transporter [Parafrankia sp. EUN1f]|uniref:MFS transporter n=1 Tax=Parafrankia sp. EUN1f TaxID=102897 RepID=UPI0001C46CB3|nr:MFS transporter [Parafrankia sp. EUN1f]EFC80354.1 major facilitator superfamily MFS_1 [Parafrankia sp. EUN1f]